MSGQLLSSAQHRKNDPSCDVVRAELMSNHCCQGKIWVRLKLELEGELRHQVVSLCCSAMCSQHRKLTLILADCSIDISRQQTQIYEAEYETEHNDHKHTLQENRRLRKKREEMRQQVALLQEQVVI